MRKIQADITALCRMAQDDINHFISWVWANRAKNSFDLKVLTHPRTCMTRAFDETGTLCLVPLQPVLMLESVAPKPDLTDRQRVLALYRITQVVEQTQRDVGMPECYFLSAPDDPLGDVAKNHGWTEVTGFRLLKRRIEPIIETSSRDGKNEVHSDAN
jgi:hypothetical protein